MKWMEVIELRTAETSPALVEQTLMTLINEFGKTGNMKDITIYHDALLENNSCIQIHWASGNAEPRGSTAGLCMVHILKEFGLVSHSVWIEAE